jgi:hypothetical protein
VVERPQSKGETIAAAGAPFAHCQFDEQGCDLGLRRLRAYRKEWDEGRGVWKDRPRHDDASHGADAFLTFACSNYSRPRLRAPEAHPARDRLIGAADCSQTGRWRERTGSDGFLE